MPVAPYPSFPRLQAPSGLLIGGLLLIDGLRRALRQSK